MNHVKKECVAMLLAGGQGSRLYALTQNMAKPAVPYGGKYRIIDFPLSNCVNSGIDTVGILTQYQPVVLNEYIGNGQPWDLDRLYGGVHVLPPYQKATGSDWFKGTANAIYQHISFIDRYDPEYVIILSGDQICKQDYREFLNFHKEKNADFSVAVMEVPWEEASRFGLMVTDENAQITEFQEKPKNPKSNLASMGNYIFKWSILRKYLIEDELDPNSDNDFGKNIIPNLLKDGCKMFAHRFDGYWKDVGTIPSLWEANMEVLDPENSGINLLIRTTDSNITEEYVANCFGLPLNSVKIVSSNAGDVLKSYADSVQPKADATLVHNGSAKGFLHCVSAAGSLCSAAGVITTQPTFCSAAGLLLLAIIVLFSGAFNVNALQICVCQLLWAGLGIIVPKINKS